MRPGNSGSFAVENHLAATQIPSPQFWTGKRVLLTGHTGFKGSWCALMLRHLGADVYGYALAPEGEISLFDLAKIEQHVDHAVGDIRDRTAMRDRVANVQPDIVLHMAAQALVRRSYADPVGTFETNVTGTAHVLDALSMIDKPVTCLVITSDKVYANDESGRAFVEGDPLGGHDPYSASKAACEILVASWRESFATKNAVTIASVRAGNVIGGGDFSQDRIVPDIWRAYCAGKPLVLRNPDATRPWQHVLDCLNGYLLFVEHLTHNAYQATHHALNFGPATPEAMTVGQVSDGLLARMDAPADWAQTANRGPAEMGRLAIDSRAARALLGWSERFGDAAMLDATAEWFKAYADDEDMAEASADQVAQFLTPAKHTTAKSSTARVSA